MLELGTTDTGELSHWDKLLGLSLPLSISSCCWDFSMYYLGVQLKLPSCNLAASLVQEHFWMVTFLAQVSRLECAMYCLWVWFGPWLHASFYIWARYYAVVCLWTDSAQSVCQILINVFRFSSLLHWIFWISQIFFVDMNNIINKRHNLFILISSILQCHWFSWISVNFGTNNIINKRHKIISSITTITGFLNFCQFWHKQYY